MNHVQRVVRLSRLVAGLAALASGAGVFWSAESNPIRFATARGTTVLLYGRGLYQFDSLFIGAGFRGQDLITLFVGVPWLLIVSQRYRRHPSLKRGLPLLGALAYFLYVYASMAFAAAFNPLFVVYVALCSASLFAFTFAFSAASAAAQTELAGLPLPRWGPGIYLLVSGVVTLLVWLVPVVGSLVSRESPELLDHYTTMFTSALDLAVITPSALLAGHWILGGDVRGYVLAFPLLGIIVMLAPTILASTLFQRAAGLSFNLTVLIGPVAGFVVLGVLGLMVGRSILSRLPQPNVHAETGALASTTRDVW